MTLTTERQQFAEQNEMSLDFVNWFFDEKKESFGNMWFLMAAALWEGWKGRANREAQPVYQFIYNNPHEEGYTEWLDCNKDYFNGVPKDCRRILYTAPPAPAVPSFDEWLESTGTHPVGWVREVMEESYNACRAAMLAQPVSSGYKLVPVEATEDMIAAAMNCDDVSFNADETFCVNFGNIYAAMMAAAPEGGK